MTAEWNKVFFCISTYMRGDFECSEIFKFGYVSRHPNDLQQYWEYVRSYMEDGPEAHYKAIKACLPIAERHETWKEGFDNLPCNWFTRPFYFFISFARVYAMRTSKVEQSC